MTSFPERVRRQGEQKRNALTESRVNQEMIGNRFDSRRPPREKAKKDFPKDRALQEVHYTLLRIHEETKGMTPEEYVKYIKAKAKKLLEQEGS